VIIGVSLFLISAAKSIYIVLTDDRASENWEILMLSSSQMISILIIIAPLVITLYKLRRFRTEYNFIVPMSKLWMHFSIAILLQLLFIFDFIMDWKLATIFWLKDSENMLLQKAKDEFKACVTW
jgi:uncharacterized membrane protein YciS (DUF1049 family)